MPPPGRGGSAGAHRGTGAPEAPAAGAENSRTARLADELLQMGPLRWATLVLALSLLKYGAGLYPAWPYMQAMAQNWRHPERSAFFARPFTHYLFDSPTSAVVAGILHITDDRAFLGFHFFLALGAIVVPFALRTVRTSPVLRLNVAILLVGGTVPALLLSWVGSYDPVSMASAALGALASNRVARALGWAVFAFNNAPQAAVALVVFAAVLLADQRRLAVPKIVPSGIGAVAGYLGVRALTSGWGGGESQLAMINHYGFHQYLLSYQYLPLVVLSALGVGWLYLLDRQVRRTVAARVFSRLSLVASLVLPLVALDTSRVTAGALWPGALATADRACERLTRDQARGVLLRVGPFALFLVVVIVWNVQLVYPGLRSLAELVLYLLGLRSQLPG